MKSQDDKPLTLEGLLDASGDDLPELAAKYPKLFNVLRRMRKEAEGHADKDTIVAGMAQLYDKVTDKTGDHMVKVFETAVVTIAKMVPGEVDNNAVVDTVVESHDPVDMFVARNDLLLSAKFRGCVREALLDMGDRPAGDVTLEEIFANALKLMLGRAVRRARKEEPLF